jgi:hypothetical protein
MRYSGDVEQVRRELREAGWSQRDARNQAPHLAQIRRSCQDRHVPPFPWLGGRALEGFECDE